MLRRGGQITTLVRPGRRAAYCISMGGTRREREREREKEVVGADAGRSDDAFSALLRERESVTQERRERRATRC